MQSAFKSLLNVAVLHAVGQGKLSLEQSVHSLPSDTYKDTFSPLQDMYPAANVDVPLRQLPELWVGHPDNTANDILLRQMGGTAPVQQYLDSLGLQGIQIRDSEASMHDDERRQYRNTGEPATFVKLLCMLAENSLLTHGNTKYLLSIMSSSPSFPNRICGLLPAGTIVAYKTGTAGYNNNMAAATNDVALITLPTGGA